MIINMDPPDNRAHRNLVNKRFMPKNIAWVQNYAAQIIDDALDTAMAFNGDEIDVVSKLAAPLPTAVIGSYPRVRTY